VLFLGLERKKMGKDLIVDRDLNCNWHPCVQMSDLQKFPPIVIKKAAGIYLFQEDGKPIIDAISSWWCKSLGHRHPKLVKACESQLELFEHVIFANTTYDIIVQLSEKLVELCSPLSRVFYASDGSSAVEIALKMSHQAQEAVGNSNKCLVAYLENSYHGETILAMSVSDCDIYKHQFKKLLLQQHTYKISGVPYLLTVDDPLWDDCSEIWPGIEKQLDPIADKLATIIVEPLVQGAGGMLIYSKDFIRRLYEWAQDNKVHFVADEIMTGFWKTGKCFAYEYAGIVPDFVCVGKGLTGGVMPFSAVITSEEIYNLFYGDYDIKKNFLHSHTYSGHALSAAVALEAIRCYEDMNVSKKIKKLSVLLRESMLAVQESTGLLTSIRSLGTIIAADILNKKNINRLGYKIHIESLSRGLLIRPLDLTMYWLPPFIINQAQILEIENASIQAIISATRNVE
jgi:adenosylmethionine---8-amino-7-oxononanoate aminotransferase